MNTNFVALGLAACSATGCFSPESAPQDGETDPAASTGNEPTSSSTTNTSGSTDLATSLEPGTSSEGSAGPSGTETTTAVTCTDALDCDGMVCIDGTCEPCSRATVPDAACTEAFPDRPYCDPDLGTCVPCTEQTKCPDGAPVCDPQVGCAGCTEHAHCPESACHLGGPDEGSCFEVADVVDVESPAALAGHLAEIGPGEQRVLRLESATYDVAGVDLGPSGREIAILGTGATILDGTAGLSSGSYVYYSRVEFSSDGVMFFIQNEGSELWFDDSVYLSTMSLDGEAHVRRSSIRTDEGSPLGFFAVRAGSEGSVHIENSSIGPSAQDGLYVYGEVDVRYSTIAGISTAIACNTPSGTIRNSIIIGSASPAVEAECDGLTWIDNAVNEPGFGTQVGDYDASWFSPSITSPFLLSTEGESVFADIATWEPGDPERDVEGDPRPQDGPGFPGVDEP
jgi:hypothetical protein